MGILGLEKGHLFAHGRTVIDVNESRHRALGVRAHAELHWAREEVARFSARTARLCLFFAWRSLCRRLRRLRVIKWRFCRRYRRASLLRCILSWRFYTSAVQAERSLQFVSDAMDTWNIFVGFSALFTRRDEERLERTTRDLKRENERARMREQEGQRQSAAMAAYRHERLIGVSALHLGSL